MGEHESFHKTLLRLIAQDKRRSTYTPGQLASLTGIRKSTIVHWLNGDVKRPHKWQQLVKLAMMLNFNESEANELLASAKHPSITELRDSVTNEKEQALLATWPRQHTPFHAKDTLADFISRDDEIERVRQWLLQSEYSGPLRLSGMAGVGKTVLATHLAHQLKSFFPDGVLWADMVGADLSETLNEFAVALEYDLSKYRGLQSKSRAFKDILTRKRALIVLDGALTYHQVEPFLPHTPSTSAVIITTRQRDLGIKLTAHPLYLEQFTPQETELLFLRILGADKVRQEKDALTELATYLGHLPIALDIAARQIKTRPHQTAADFLAGVHQAENRLDYLTDKERSVRALFEASYQVLPDTLQQFFAALSVFAGRDFEVQAVAGVTQQPLARAKDLLGELRNLSLIQDTREGRFQLHALVDEYARERNIDGHTYVRMSTYYITFAQEQQRNYKAIALESRNILGSLTIAAESKNGLALLRGANALFYYWDTGGLYDLAANWLKQAEQFARNQEDQRILSVTLKNLGHFERLRGNVDIAETHLQESLLLAQALDDRMIISQILGELGLLQDRAGKFAEAEAYYLDSLALSRELEDRRGISKVLVSLGGLVSDTGRHELAMAYLYDALDMARQIGDLDNLGTVFNNLGTVSGRQGEYTAEEEYYKEALAIARRTRNRLDICYRLSNLGALMNTKGEFELSLAYLDEALAIAMEIGDPERIATTLRLMGEINNALGLYAEAKMLLLQALSYIEDLDLPVGISAVLANLGLSMVFLEDYEGAEQCFEKSVTLAREAGHTWYLLDALNKQGELLLQEGKLNQAAEVFNEAHELSRNAGYQELFGEALFGQARVAYMRGDRARAARLAQESLAVFEALGYYMKARVKEWLTSFDQDRAQV